jgi:hypothetical protein
VNFNVAERVVGAIAQLVYEHVVGDREVVVGFKAESSDLPLFLKRPDRLWGPAILLFRVCPGEERPRCEPDHASQSSAEIETSLSYRSFPHFTPRERERERESRDSAIFINKLKFGLLLDR